MRFKHWLFRNHAWVCMGAAIAAVMLAIGMKWLDEPFVIGGIFASIISFFFVVQQQRLQETRFFMDLFAAFNDRYNNLNERLAEIKDARAFSMDGRVTLIDYFNLCAEEYLFYKEGYIHGDVWQAWCNGMLQYLEVPAVADLWRDEESTRSYYGLSLRVIRAAAHGQSAD